jgi:hypothetical protein
VDLAHHVGGVEAALFARDLCVEDNLQQQVAKFFREFQVVAAFQSFENLVSFLKQIGAQRQMGLLDIPGTSIRGTQTRLQFDQAFEPQPGRFLPRTGIPFWPISALGGLTDFLFLWRHRAVSSFLVWELKTLRRRMQIFK